MDRDGLVLEENLPQSLPNPIHLVKKPFEPIPMKLSDLARTEPFVRNTAEKNDELQEAENRDDHLAAEEIEKQRGARARKGAAATVCQPSWQRRA